MVIVNMSLVLYYAIRNFYLVFLKFYIRFVKEEKDGDDELNEDEEDSIDGYQQVGAVAVA